MSEQTRRTALIMGNTGAGKTTLYNILTNNNYKTGSARNNVTKANFISSVNTGNNPFDIIDTPGIDSNENPIADSLLLKFALTTRPLCTIFIVVKYSSRFNNIQDDLFRLSEIVYKYQYKIVVLISHMDISVNVEADEKEITDMLSEDFPNLVFYDKQTLERNNSWLSDRMFAYISKMKPENLEIKDLDFFTNFKVYELKRNQKREYLKFEKEIILVKHSFNEKLLNFKGKNLLNDEILHSMIVNYRYIMNGINQKYLDKFKTEMNDLNYYGFAIKIKKDTIKFSDQFSEELGKLMTFDLTDMTNPKNLIKRCPHCQEIWFKVEGCDDQTNCGNKPTKVYDFFEKASNTFKYIFEWKNKKLHYEKKNENIKIMNLNESLISKNSNLSEKSNSFTRRGCGGLMDWKSLPCLEEEILLSFFSVNSMEEVKHIISNQSYSNSITDVKNTIEFRLHEKGCVCIICNSHK